MNPPFLPPAIPGEIPPEQYAGLIRDYCREFFVFIGLIAGFAIHDKGYGNPHAHILLTVLKTTHSPDRIQIYGFAFRGIEVLWVGAVRMNTKIW